MFYFTDGPTDENVFAFYDDLVLASLTQFQHEYFNLVTEWTVEGEIDQDIAFHHGGHMPDIDKYYKYISKTQSKYLFHAIESEIEKQTTEDQKRTHGQNIISKITYYIHKIKQNEKIIEQSAFIDDLELLKADIQVRFHEIFNSKKAGIVDITPKLKWTGTINQLATLFYDLWKGQEKLKRPSSKPMIETSKAELMNFLLNNFIDKDNKSLNESSLNDYLNQSKSEKRAKEGKRIELEIPV